MAAIVTLEVFSGRPDPNWLLTDNDEAEFERLVASAPVAARPASSQVEPLGYRGFHVRIKHSGTRPTHVKIFDGWIKGRGTRKDPGRVLERWLLTTAHGAIPNDLTAYIQSEINVSP
jgi:hypothetical protein